MRFRAATIATLLAVLPAITDALGAIEVDFSLGNGSALNLSADTTTFSQQNTLGLGLRAPFTSEAELRVGVTGSFVSADGATPQLGLSVDQLLFSVESLTDAGLASLNLGRLAVAEPTGIVANLPADGVRIGLITPRTTWELTAAYTGLPIGVGQSERRAQWIGTATVAFPELFARQSIIATLTGATAAPGLDGNVPESFLTAYGSLVLTGPISTQTFYTVFGVLSLFDGVLDGIARDGVSGAAGLSLRHYFQDPWDTAILVDTGLATGGDLPFRPLTNTSLAELLPGVFGNVVGIDVLFTTKPVSFGGSDRLGVSPRLGARLLARLEEGPGTIAGLDTATAAGIVGTEAELGVEIRPSSDVRIGASGIVAIPTDLPVTGGVLADTSPLGRIGIDLEVSF